MRGISAKIEVLSQAEIGQIHEATLEVLRTVGCRLPHRRVLDRLRDQGAAVDYGRAEARFPPALIEKAMRELAPERDDAGGARNLLRRGRVDIHPGNQANIIDYGTKTRRPGTTADVLKGIVLCNELPRVAGIMPLVTPADVPAHMGDLYGYYLCALYAKKPYGVYILSPESGRRIIAMAELVAGRGKARVGYLLEPNGALSYDDFSLEMAISFAEAGQTFHLGPMAMAGLDAPVTLAGTLVMQNAYNLIGNVIAYLWGVPGGWSGSAHTLDLRSGLCSFGSPNQILLGVAAAQLGDWYGFRAGANCALTDACLPDFQAGFEKGSSAMAMLLLDRPFGAQGIVGADQGTSLEQLVLDDEWAGAMDHAFSRGIEVSDETLGVEAIRRVGILGSFLADEHTIRHMRETYWHASVFNNESFDAWAARGGKDAYARAHERVEEILARHYPPEPVVTPEIRAALDAMIAEAMAAPGPFQAERYRYRG
ncbi:MAG: trimethylamine methyltransferase family protein [Patescibacteria group bacterium]